MRYLRRYLTCLDLHRGEILLYILYTPLEKMSIGARFLDIELEICLVLEKDVDHSSLVCISRCFEYTNNPSGY